MMFALDAEWDATPAGVYKGVTEIREMVEDFTSTLEDFGTSAGHILELPGGVTLATIGQRARLRGSAHVVERRYTHVTKWIGGLIVRTTSDTDLDQARAAPDRLAEERG